MLPDAVSMRQNALRYVLGRGSTPDPYAGVHGAPPDLLTGLRGSACKRRERREGKKKTEKTKKRPKIKAKERQRE